MPAAQTLTTEDLMRSFGVTHMTVFNWRQGSPTRAPLPFEQNGRAVSFRPSKVEAWARKHGLVPVAPLAPAGAARKKPGPKTAPAAEEVR